MIFRRRRDSFESGFSLDRLIAAPLRWIGRLFRRSSTDQDWSRVEQAGFWVTIWQWIVFPFRFLLGFLGFLVTIWSVSRRGRPFLWGLPAFTATFLFFASVLAHSYFNQKIVGRYVRASSLAFNQEEYVFAEGYGRKAFEMRFPDDLSRVPAEEMSQIMQVAAAVKENRGLAESVSLLESMFSRYELGNLEAHVWIAEQFLAMPKPSESQLVEIGEHLSKAYRLKPDDFKVNYLYCQYYELRGDKVAMVDHLKMLYAQRPDTLPMLLRVLKDLNREEQFRVALREGVTALHELARQYPNEYLFWYAMIQSVILDNDYPQALDFVREAESLSTSVQLKNRLNVDSSALMVSWFDKSFKPDDESKFKLGIRQMNLSVALVPFNTEALSRVRKIYLDPNLTDQQIQWILEVMDRDLNDYVSQILFGLRELALNPDEGIKAARAYWTIAETKVPQRIGPIMCGLALSIVRDDESQADLAYHMLDVAISEYPQNPWYPQGKGFLYVEQKRWTDAKKQLEEVLPDAPAKGEVLTLLIRCAQELKDVDMEAKYRLQLDQLKASAQSQF